MSYNIVFSNEKVTEINNYIHDRIDERLFLFAYYCPKNDGEGGELDFWKGITNIYGLFKDCAAFVQKGVGKNDFLGLIIKYKLVDTHRKKQIEDFMKDVNALRSVFSHNNSTEYSKNIKNIEVMNEFFSKINGNVCEFSSYNDIKFSFEEWDKCLDYIISESDQSIDTFEVIINNIEMHTNKSEIISKWCLLIIEWYKSNFKDILYKALSNKVTLYLLLRRKKCNKAELINLWAKKFKDDCKDKMEDTISNNQIRSFLPIEFMDSIIDFYNPFEYWDNYFSIKK